LTRWNREKAVESYQKSTAFVSFREIRLCIKCFGGAMINTFTKTVYEIKRAESPLPANIFNCLLGHNDITVSRSDVQIRAADPHLYVLALSGCAFVLWIIADAVLIAQIFGDGLEGGV
jgi:hypothetical protein